MITRAAAIGAAALTLAGVPAIARASDNDIPSRAVTIAPGVPLTGVWPGTGRSVTYGYSSITWMTHWWRFPGTLRVGDTVTIAVDQAGQDGVVYLCLAPPTDDFGAIEALGGPSGCDQHDATKSPFVVPDQRRRITLTYGLGTGQGFLVTSAHVYADSAYTFTVERIITRVNPGFTIPSRVSRALSITASLRYGDNSPVADGVRATLELKRPGSSRYQRIAAATSTGGNVKLNGNLAASLRRKRVSLRVCAAQPGGSTARCTSSRQVRIR